MRVEKNDLHQPRVASRVAGSMERVCVLGGSDDRKSVRRW